MANKKPVPASVSHIDDLDRRLQNTKFAAAFLKASFMETEGGDFSAFLLALQDVIRAHNLTSVAKRAGLSRDALYKATRKDGNPTLETLVAVLRELDMRLTVEPIEDAKSRARKRG